MNSTEKNILVSIIIPIYNAGKFLEETIESVLSQSLKEFELILINDGSTDNSAEICTNYHNKDPRIKFFSQENSGVSVARNFGLSHAIGEYIFFMDSDDTLNSDFLRTSYNNAEVQKCDILIIGEYYCQRLPNVPALPTWAQFLRSDFLKRHQDVRFPKGIQPCEDGLFSHQLIALTEKIGINPDGIYHYREHENQNHLKINENSEKVLSQIPMWLSILENFYERNDFYETHALHLALFIEHEPFEFRYIAMPFNDEQKDRLFKIINNFIDKNVKPYLNHEDYSKLSKRFLYFINSENSSEFTEAYKKYEKKKAFNKKIRLFLAKLIPFGNIRRKLRKEINQKYA